MSARAPETARRIPSDRTASRRLGSEFERVASGAKLERVARALRGRGFDAEIVDGPDAARAAVLRRLGPSDEVLEAGSQTLREIGLLREGSFDTPYRRLRPDLERLAREGLRDEKRRRGASPDVVLGSVQAVTEHGEVLVASGSGSQLGPYGYGAGRVIWVIGAQKIVRDLDAGLRRLREYAQPREDERVRRAGGSGSSLNKLLVVFGEHQPHRITIILSRTRLGS